MFVSLDPQRKINDLNKVHANVQSTSRMCRRTHPRLRNIQIADLYTYEDHLQLIPISSIDGPAFVTENFVTDDIENDECNSVIVMTSKDTWPSVYNSEQSKYQSV